MGEILRFFKDNEVFIYLILGVFTIWQLRKFALAWGELRSAAFGLERQSAQRRVNLVASTLILLLILVVTEFSLVSFVVPSVPGASSLATQTLDLLSSPTITLEPGLIASVSTPVPGIEMQAGNCVPGRVDITSPKDGDVVHDIVEITGSADIPGFGFYKFEMAALNDISWLTIQAGEIITVDGRLGYWDTSRLDPGDYALRLIVVDNQGQSTEPCVVNVKVEPSTEGE